VPSLLLQKLPAETFTVTTQLDASGLANGGVAGLVMYGSDYAWLGTRRNDGTTQLALVSCYKADANCHEQQEAGVDLPSPKVWLRMQVLAGGVAQFSYSADGVKYTPSAPSSPPKWAAGSAPKWVCSAPASVATPTSTTSASPLITASSGPS
jgi:beta-xylosidase